LVSHLRLYFVSKSSELHRKTRKRKNDKMGTYYDTILDASSEKLSSEAAEVMSVRINVVINQTLMQSLSSKINQQQSPLLRLPAELRNKIYEYALGGMELHISSRSRMSDQFSVVSSDPSFDNIPLHRLIGLTLVSQQLYAETKLLPFELGTVRTTASTPRAPIKRLSVTQRQAISSIRVDYWYASDCRFWMFCPAVKALKGLKRVVVFDCPEPRIVEEDDVVGMIKKSRRRADVGVEFEFRE
jgi:hypothetical protein